MPSKSESPLDLLPEDVREKIAKAKSLGNPVRMTKIGGEDYVYIGLMRSDVTKIRLAGQEAGKAIRKKYPQAQEDEDVAARALAELENIEEDIFLEYSILHPKLDLEKLSPGRAASLRDLVNQASGQGEEVSEPVAL